MLCFDRTASALGPCLVQFREGLELKVGDTHPLTSSRYPSFERSSVMRSLEGTEGSLSESVCPFSVVVTSSSRS